MPFQKGHKIFQGRHHSDETKKKISRTKKGQNPWNKGKTNVQIPWNKERKGIWHHSEESKRKIKETLQKIGHRPPILKRENSPNWQGGSSFEPYGLEFNEDLKEVIRNRDRRKCQICEKTELENKERLIIHHINYDKKNNNPNNLISLCRGCHTKTNHNRNYWLNYFNQ